MVASLYGLGRWFLAVPLNQIEATASKCAKETLRHPRISHSSHLLLLQHVWVIEGKPTKMKGTNHFWETLAARIYEELNKPEESKPEAYRGPMLLLAHRVRRSRARSMRFAFL
jgi:hypothetical protein